MKILIERTYALKQYENIKLHSEIDIEHEELYQKYFYLQFLKLEVAYREYLKLLKELSDLNIEDSLIKLQTEEVNTLELIKNYILENTKKEN